MSDKKDINQLTQQEAENRVKSGDIDGKIEVPDTRERRDGPGGD